MQIEQQTWLAQEYANNSSAQFQWGLESFSMLDLHGDEVLLDIGCGDGKITARLAQLLPQGTVIGIDASDTMIDLAIQHFPQMKYPNLKFQQMDAAELDFPPIFDIVYSTSVFHWLSDQVNLLKRIHACLKPGGRLFAEMRGRNHRIVPVNIGQELTRATHWQPYFKDFTFPLSFLDAEDYRALLEKCNFRVIRAEMVFKKMEYDGKEGLKNWIRPTWFLFTNYLPAELKDQFLEEAVEIYTTHFPADQDGKVYVEVARLKVDACT